MAKIPILLHTCCGPCLTWPSQFLSQDYDVSSYFYNPNIHPLTEYERRREELIAFTKKQNIQLIVEDPDFDYWSEMVIGLENEKEGSERCWICYRMRLEKTAQYAANNGFNIFTTVLSISPFKNADKINEIGPQIADKYNIKFLEANFKKDNGFKKSCELSKQFNLYRQNYCGCKFSIRK